MWGVKSSVSEKYRNLGGNSDISFYEVGPDYIKVHFRELGKIYKYSYRTAGKSHVEKMKSLAVLGRGLGTYISENMRQK